MNIFKIKLWILLIFFTIPCLIFSEEPIVVSIFFFLFYLLYLPFLSNIESKDKRHVLVRNKIECFILLVIYSSYPISVLIGKEIRLSENFKIIFSFIYFAILIDLAINLSTFLLTNTNRSKSVGKVIIIFFCLLVPPLGIYYLRHLYYKLY
jgi:heme/copper-type cytochrome/quinol oxidase subunit 4